MTATTLDRLDASTITLLRLAAVTASSDETPVREFLARNVNVVPAQCSHGVVGK